MKLKLSKDWRPCLKHSMNFGSTTTKFLNGHALNILAKIWKSWTIFTLLEIQFTKEEKNLKKNSEQVSHVSRSLKAFRSIDQPTCMNLSLKALSRKALIQRLKLFLKIFLVNRRQKNTRNSRKKINEKQKRSIKYYKKKI